MPNQRIPDPARIGLIMGAIFASLVALVLYVAACGGSASAAPQGLAPHPHEARMCFPKGTWNAEPGFRPCGAIRRVYEDGSVVLAVEDANGTTRYTLGIGARDR